MTDPFNRIFEDARACAVVAHSRHAGAKQPVAPFAAALPLALIGRNARCN